LKSATGGEPELFDIVNIRLLGGTSRASDADGGLEINAGPMGGMGGVPLGNEVALNVKGGGPGKGYVQHGQSGSQGCHGKPDTGEPMPRKSEVFPGFGKR
jgi:hypothetical protein